MFLSKIFIISFLNSTNQILIFVLIIAVTHCSYLLNLHLIFFFLFSITLKLFLTSKVHRKGNGNIRLSMFYRYLTAYYSNGWGGNVVDLEVKKKCYSIDTFGVFHSFTEQQQQQQLLTDDLMTKTFQTYMFSIANVVSLFSSSVSFISHWSISQLNNFTFFPLAAAICLSDLVLSCQSSACSFNSLIVSRCGDTYAKNFNVTSSWTREEGTIEEKMLHLHKRLSSSSVSSLFPVFALCHN